jgi:hypothetical protein
LANAITLSDSALSLFRLHLEHRRTLDLDANREAYRELERAGLMVSGRAFTGAVVYSFTKLGFEKRPELLATTSHAPDSAASPRR